MDPSGSERVHVELLPRGIRLAVARGTPLQDVLFEQGVEFPCGGRGRCRGCRVRVLAGEATLDDVQRALLSADEIAGGWRLACRCRAESDLTIELTQWEAVLLSDQSRFAFAPREGLGAAVDLGTTTIVAQLLDLASGRVLAVRAALNAQARYGADVMSRIEAALGPTGAELRRAVRQQIGGLVAELLREVQDEPRALARVVLVGNAAMHHLFCGLDLAPLAALPFEPSDPGPQRLTAGELGWPVPEAAEIVFLPCLGGFVGSDVLAGIRAVGLDRADALTGLVDLGTNGEIVVGTGERLLCASAAAGPAFEGARISCGMRAATGAISAVTRAGGELRCHVIGGGAPHGVCGSGLVDAVAAGLDLGRIEPSGRLAGGAASLALCPSVELTQRDIREVQLAKGAIAAGLGLLLGRLGADSRDLARLCLAGAFGNYIERESARRIGLLAVAPERIEAVGNTALLGAKLALFDDDWQYAALRGRVEHVSLHTDPGFQDRFAREMAFP